MPTPPTLTKEQREEAFRRSLYLRRERAEIKRFVSTGFIRFDFAWDLTEAQGMKVYSLLRALPGVGEATAVYLLNTAGIGRDLSVAQCGPRQTERLFALLDKR